MTSPKELAGDMQTEATTARCVGGLHEVCVGVPDLDLAAASIPRCARCVCCISRPITASCA
ncbi:MAG: hypothetical protein EBV65_06360 [Gammaproteobacteria bacterium]|nr:hypothetical protein [Gammaproteobacteria bacterium]